MLEKEKQRDLWSTAGESSIFVYNERKNEKNLYWTRMIGENRKKCMPGLPDHKSPDIFITYSFLSPRFKNVLLFFFILFQLGKFIKNHFVRRQWRKFRHFVRIQLNRSASHLKFPKYTSKWIITYRNYPTTFPKLTVRSINDIRVLRQWGKTMLKFYTVGKNEKFLNVFVSWRINYNFVFVIQSAIPRLSNVGSRVGRSHRCRNFKILEVKIQ